MSNLALAVGSAAHVVTSRPRAARPTWSKASLVGGLVAAPGLTIDPAVAERFVERLVVRKAGRLGRATLGEGKSHPDRIVVISGEPRPPRGCVSDDELWQFVAHSYSAFQTQTHPRLGIRLRRPWVRRPERPV